MSGMVLRGIDAANPLAYLAALGAFRLLTSARPAVQLRWVMDGVWRPEFLGAEDCDERVICDLLVNAPGAPVDLFSELLGKNITVDAGMFKCFTDKAAELATAGDRRSADFAAAFGSEVCVDEKKDRVDYTSFCFITGSGHQDFLDTMKTLADKVKPEHLSKTLFENWESADKGLSMRWDPAEAREYALRWSNPGPERVWTMWGANRLAVEALPFFPAHPAGSELKTTGFRAANRTEATRWPEFTWPVWTQAVNCDTVRSLVSLSELQASIPDRQILRQRGIGEVYRAQRIRIGVGANFKTSFSSARAV